MNTVATRRWVRRPEGSTWGDFGDDDRLGRLDLITPERRRAALAEAREGVVFCLSLPLDVGPGMNPSRFPPKLSAAIRDGLPRYNACACAVYPGLTDVVCDDKVDAAQGRHRFLLTAPPLRLPGAVGSPVTPVATV